MSELSNNSNAPTVSVVIPLYNKGRYIDCIFCNQQLSRVIFIKKDFSIVQCLSCGLVYVGNPPSEAELKKLYSFDSGYHTGFRDDDSKSIKKHLNTARRHYELIKKHKTRGRILDIGCSAGFFLKVAKENNWEPYGLEISKDNAELARKRYGLEILTGTLQENTFMPDFFDVVTMWDVIEHVQNPLETMSIINRILKDDGIVAFSTPNIDGLFPKLSYLISDIINYWPHPEPPCHLFQFSKKTTHKLLERSGFTLLEEIDERIPITYTFDSFKRIIKSPKKLFYSAFFVPIALIGPIVHAGDSIIVIANKAYQKTMN